MKNMTPAEPEMQQAGQLHEQYRAAKETKWESQIELENKRRAEIQQNILVRKCLVYNSKLDLYIHVTESSDQHII